MATGLLRDKAGYKHVEQIADIVSTVEPVASCDVALLFKVATRVGAQNKSLLYF